MSLVFDLKSEEGLSSVILSDNRIMLCLRGSDTAAAKWDRTFIVQIRLSIIKSHAQLHKVAILIALDPNIKAALLLLSLQNHLQRCFDHFHRAFRRKLTFS